MAARGDLGDRTSDDFSSYASCWPRHSNRASPLKPRHVVTAQVSAAAMKQGRPRRPFKPLIAAAAVDTGQRLFEHHLRSSAACQDLPLRCWGASPLASSPCSGQRPFQGCLRDALAHLHQQGAAAVAVASIMGSLCDLPAARSSTPRRSSSNGSGEPFGGVWWWLLPRATTSATTPPGCAHRSRTPHRNSMPLCASRGEPGAALLRSQGSDLSLEPSLCERSCLVPAGCWLCGDTELGCQPSAGPTPSPAPCPHRSPRRDAWPLFSPSLPCRAAPLQPAHDVGHCSQHRQHILPRRGRLAVAAGCGPSARAGAVLSPPHERRHRRPQPAV
jgi:hypothetical protein